MAAALLMETMFVRGKMVSACKCKWSTSGLQLHVNGRWSPRFFFFEKTLVTKVMTLEREGE